MIHLMGTRFLGRQMRLLRYCVPLFVAIIVIASGQQVILQVFIWTAAEKLGLRPLLYASHGSTTQNM